MKEIKLSSPLDCKHWKYGKLRWGGIRREYFLESLKMEAPNGNGGVHGLWWARQSSIKLDTQTNCTSAQNVFLQTEPQFPPDWIGDPKVPQFKNSLARGGLWRYKNVLIQRFRGPGMFAWDPFWVHVPAFCNKDKNIPQRNSRRRGVKRNI